MRVQHHVISLAENAAAHGICTLAGEIEGHQTNPSTTLKRWCTKGEDTGN
jgi:hypothetical protein